MLRDLKGSVRNSCKFVNEILYKFYAIKLNVILKLAFFQNINKSRGIKKYSTKNNNKSQSENQKIQHFDKGTINYK